MPGSYFVLNHNHHNEMFQLTVFLYYFYILMYYLLYSISFMILFYPVYWEVRDDRRGDFDKALDVFVRAVLIIGVGGVSYLLREITNGHFEYVSFKYTMWRVLKPILTSGVIFFMFFDYCINYVLGHKLMFTINGDGWLQYTGRPYQLVMTEAGRKGVRVTRVKNLFDNLKVWQRLGWEGRLVIKIVVFCWVFVYIL